MLWSVYATDDEEVRDAVVEQACSLGAVELFTSLHMPETQDPASWVRWMGHVHRTRGARFWADVSPAGLARLGPAGADLAGCGVVGLRLDYGYDVEGVRAVAAATGLPIALNASTVGAAVLDALAGVEGLVGWHNFYPRPGTGLDGGYYARQSRLFTSRGLRLLAFVPGEVTRRAPLYRGLPTLEEHRHRDAYTSAVRLRALADGVEVVCAEGVVAPHHLEWIRRAEDGVLTLPVNLAPGCAWLEGDWRLRVEETGRSHRLEGTRGRALSGACANADAMETGSLQMDTLGRYRGEVHLMTATAPLDGEHVRLGEVAAPYRCLVGLLRGGQQVRLVRADRPAAGALADAGPPV